MGERISRLISVVLEKGMGEESNSLGPRDIRT